MEPVTTPRLHVDVVVLCTVLLVVQACGHSQPPDTGLTVSPSPNTSNSPDINPETVGGCPSLDDGSRPGYHSAHGSTWIRDCDNMLHREYWRVFLQHDQSAYIIRRPDGAPELAIICTDAQHALRSLIDQYRLCTQAADTAHVKQVNTMKPEDALQITHFLHTQLRFRTVDDGITPFPIPSDIIDACNLHPESNSPDLTAICEREHSRLKSGHDISFTYTGPGAIELVDRLNELYGIP